MKTTTKPLTYLGVTKPITLNICTPEEYANESKLYGAENYDAGLARAFEEKDTIYVLEGQEVDLELLGHEIGHCFGLDHPTDLLPAIADAIVIKHFGTMSFSGVLRWHDWEGLEPLAQQLLSP